MSAKEKYRLIAFWAVMTLAAEAVMVLFRSRLFLIYIIIAALFLGGFTLRVLHLYPGKKEPLILDSSALVLAFGFALTSYFFKAAHTRLFLISISSLIIIPHLIYILAVKKT